MKIKGYTQVEYSEFRIFKGETLHIIKQDTEENGCITKKVLYFKKKNE